MADVKLNKRLARSQQIQQWTPGIRPTWDVAKVKSALYEHQTGAFAQSALLVEAMYADDELPTSLDRAVNQIVGSEFSLVPEETEDGKPDPNSEKQAEALKPLWASSFPEHELAKMVRWFLMLGVAIGTLDWDTSKAPWRPTLRTLHPEFLWWDEGTIDPQTGMWGVFRYNSRDGTNEIVTPGDGKWVLLSDGRESWMRCSVRALATTWLVKQYAWRDWQRYNERHGLPIVIAKVPVQAAADEKSDFFNDVKSLHSETTALLPQFNPEDGPNYELDLLEAKDQSWDTFRAVIERVDRKIQVHFLGTNTNELIGTAGSRATSETGRNITGETAAERERRIVTDLRDQLVKPFSAVNVPGADLDLAPWPHFNTEGEEDVQKRAEGMKALGEALKSLETAGWDVANVQEEAERFGLTLVEREEPEPIEQPGRDAAMSSNDNMGNTGKPERPGGGEAKEEKLSQDCCGDDHAQLASTDPVRVEDVGKRDGAVAAQRYLDSLVDALSDRADVAEAISARRMAEIVAQAKDENDLFALLDAEVDDAAPVDLAEIYTDAILLSQLAAKFAVEEDL